MPTLSMIRAATRVHVAPDTIKAWHTSGLVSALKAGRPGVSWLFDQATFDREVANLPRCSYRRVDETAGLTVRCDRPVGQPGTACKRHQVALAVKSEGEDQRRARTGKSGQTQRKHENRDYYCEAEGCDSKLRVRDGSAIARRRRRLAQRLDGDTRVLCGSCAAERRHQEKPYNKGRWRLCPSCGAGPDWWTPCQERAFKHCARCFRSAPDVREKRREARLDFLATPEGKSAHELALHGAQQVHKASTSTLSAEGLVPAKEAAAMVAPLINYSPSTILQSLNTQRREPNGLPRLGAYPEDVLAADVNGNRLDAEGRRKLGGKLAKLQSVRKGTEFGKPPIDKKRPGTTARIVELYESGHSYRAIADELGVSKSHVGDVIKRRKSR